MNPLEIAAAVFGVINVALVVRRSIWNYPFGLVTVVLYARVFLDAKLYSDALLQVFFFAIQLYGWRHWSRSIAGTGALEVRVLPNSTRAALAVLLVFVIAGWGAAMHRYTDAASPWWDAAVAMTSVLAQILLSRRYLESWHLWIAVDVLAIGLFFARDLRVTAALYALFLMLALWGLQGWKRALASSPR